jgi:glycerophosphoryl diester phosphodiesterase
MTAIGEIVLTDPSHGLCIERDDTDGDPNGQKRIYRFRLADRGAVVEKELVVADLMNIDDASGVALRSGAQAGELGIGPRFQMPFFTIESVALLPNGRLLVVNDNNYPFGLGRKKAGGRPDDTEWVVLDVGGR